MLDAIMTKSLSDEGLDQLIQHSNSKNIGRNKPTVKLLLCNDCTKVFTSDHGLNIHVGKAHTKSEPELLSKPTDTIPRNKWDNCNNNFPTKSALKIHIKLHDRPKLIPTLKCKTIKPKVAFKPDMLSNDKKSVNVKNCNKIPVLKMTS